MFAQNLKKGLYKTVNLTKALHATGALPLNTSSACFGLTAAHISQEYKDAIQGTFSFLM